MFRARRLLPWIVFAHAALIFTLAWLRFSTCHNQTFDLALYARGAWGLARGDVWNPIADANVLHTHAAWILWPLGLLGRVLGTVPVVLAAQALAIAACLWPLARVAERHLGEHGPLIAALMWIGFPNLGHVGSYEMHPGSLALLPLCWAMDAIDRKDARALLLAVLGVLVCRADYALLTCVMGLLLAFDPTNVTPLRRQGALIAGGSVVYLALVMALQHVWSAHGPSSAMLHFGDWGGSPLGVIAMLFKDPARVWQHFATWPRISYVARVMLPLSLLPLLAPRLLWLAAPTLVLNLISHWPTATRLDSHYLSPALPALTAAALIGLAQLRTRAPHLSRCALVAPVVTSLWLGGFPWSLDFSRQAFVADARTDACRAIADKVPHSASIQAPDSLLPHLAERAIVHRGPPPERGTDYTVLDVTHRQRFAQREDLLRTREEPLTRTWLSRGDHAVVRAAPPWLLLARGPSPRTGWVARFFVAPPSKPVEAATTLLTRCLAVEDARIHPSSMLHLTLRALSPCPPDLALRIGGSPRPTRVDLPFEGVLSPAHLRPGDSVISSHRLTGTEVATIDKQGLWVGALRSSGAVPEHGDPVARRIPVETAP